MPIYNYQSMHHPVGNMLTSAFAQMLSSCSLAVVVVFLDCIGSAFNSKGTMQCPNCRQVEDGEWLYANGCCRYYEEEAIHRNFVYAQDADQSYQPGVWWLQESIPVFYSEAVCLIRKQSPSTA